MPKLDSAWKALRQTKKRTEQNKKKKSEIQYLIKKTKRAILSKDTGQAKEYLSKTYKALDKAVKKNIIKKNTAARRKSRLTKTLNAVVK